MHVHQLTYHYPKATRPVLDGVSFTLQPNKLNVLIGQNGAGKTTLFDCMTGTLSVDKESLELVPTADMLYLTQLMYNHHELTGKDFAYFIGRLSQRPDFKKLESYMNNLSTSREQKLFEHLWTMKLGKMSVGEKKWLFVTLLSSIKRSLYLFDEPTSGVDPASRIQIMRRLQRLVDEGNVSSPHISYMTWFNLMPMSSSCMVDAFCMKGTSKTGSTSLERPTRTKRSFGWLTRRLTM